ncbi:MAG: hypothetical protein ABSG53_12900 [Thermoguttaceae bacterium]
MTTPALLPQSGASLSEAGSLARELVKARNQLLDYYRKEYGCSGPEAIAKVDEFTSAANVERILAIPPDRTGWHDLEQLAVVDPELLARRWEEMKKEAFAELASGHRAAKAVESAENSCWRRAQFLAVRDDLVRDWRPRDGAERVLIDMMAQSMTLQMFWTERMVVMDALEWPDPPSKEMAKWQPPRLNETQGIELAAAMVDRWNRMFLRTLRQLRDLRRYTVVIQSAEQVNIGQQQVNVAARPEDSAEADKPPVVILEADGAGQADDRPGVVSCSSDPKLESH